MMQSDTPTHHTLLDELDERQDDVLDQLDELNRRIEMLLIECSAQARQASAEEAEKAA